MVLHVSFTMINAYEFLNKLLIQLLYCDTLVYYDHDCHIAYHIETGNAFATSQPIRLLTVRIRKAVFLKHSPNRVT